MPALTPSKISPYKPIYTTNAVVINIEKPVEN
jgi:hypothetical protein